MVIFKELATLCRGMLEFSSAAWLLYGGRGRMWSRRELWTCIDC